MHITLIGPPGAGKSYIGRKLAIRRKMNFVDIDEKLEERFGKPLQEILDIFGEEKFIQIEANEVEGLLLENPTVIAPGGSIICSVQAMEYLKSISTVVYLEVPFEIIFSRVDIKARGIVGIANKSLQEIYTERDMLCRKYADYIINNIVSEEGILTEIATKIV